MAPPDGNDDDRKARSDRPARLLSRQSGTDQVSMLSLLSLLPP